jgi:hypothetical protein
MQSLARGFSGVAACRSKPLSQQEENIVTLLDEAGEYTRAACAVPYPESPRPGLQPERPIGSWAIRINFRYSPPEPNRERDPGKSRYETYWVDSTGTTAVADLRELATTIPCVGAVTPVTLATIEQTLLSVLSEPRGEPGGAICTETEYIALEANRRTADGTLSLDMGFAEAPSCRRRAISAQLEQLWTLVRSAGDNAKAVCAAAAN